MCVTRVVINNENFHLQLHSERRSPSHSKRIHLHITRCWTRYQQIDGGRIPVIIL